MQLLICRCRRPQRCVGVVHSLIVGAAGLGEQVWLWGAGRWPSVSKSVNVPAVGAYIALAIPRVCRSVCLAIEETPVHRSVIRWSEGVRYGGAALCRPA